MSIQIQDRGVIAQVAIDLVDVFRNPDAVPLPGAAARRIQSYGLPPEIRALGLGDLARRMAESLWATVERKFQQGIRLRLHPYRRVIRLFDYVDYEITGGGRYITARFDDVGGSTFEADVYVASPLPQKTWTDNLLIRDLPVWRGQVGAALATHAYATQANPEIGRIQRTIEEWALGVVQSLAAWRIDRGALSRLLKQLLQIDPDTLRLAARLGYGKAVSGGASASQIREVGQWKRLLLEVEQHAPALLDLFWIERKRWSPNIWSEAPLRSLRRDFLHLGVKRVAWTRLCHLRARPIWKHWFNRRIKNVGELKQFLADWARLHAALPSGVRIPVAMWETLTLTYVDPGSMVVHPPVNWPCHGKVTLEAIAVYHASRVIGRDGDFVHGDWARVVRWAADYSNEGRVTIKRTWRGALRAAELDERMLRARSEGEEKVWPSPFRDECIGSLRIIPITSEEALVEEAIAMRNCADRMDRDALGRSLHLVSIRCRETMQRLATACFWSGDEGLSLGEIRGVANSPARDDVLRVANLVLADVSISR